MGFLNVSGEAEIHTIPEIGKKWIPIMRVKYGKNKHSKVMGFSNILGKQKSTQFPKYVKSEFPYQGKNMGKHKHFKVKGFLNFSYEAEIQAVPKT